MDLLYEVEPGGRTAVEPIGVGLRPFFWQEQASRDFFASIREGRSASPGFTDALIAHATVEAAYRSAEQKTGVVVGELLTG